MISCCVDIGGIIDYHCLNITFVKRQKKRLMFSVHKLILVLQFCYTNTIVYGMQFKSHNVMNMSLMTPSMSMMLPFSYHNYIKFRVY